MVDHFVTIQKPDPKSVQKMAIQKPNDLVFGRSLYTTVFAVTWKLASC
jgi:hypothetical protein